MFIASAVVMRSPPAARVALAACSCAEFRARASLSFVATCHRERHLFMSELIAACGVGGHSASAHGKGTTPKKQQALRAAVVRCSAAPAPASPRSREQGAGMNGSHRERLGTVSMSRCVFYNTGLGPGYTHQGDTPLVLSWSHQALKNSWLGLWAQRRPQTCSFELLACMH